MKAVNMRLSGTIKGNEQLPLCTIRRSSSTSELFEERSSSPSELFEAKEQLSL
jgi:hypothetical protein